MSITMKWKPRKQDGTTVGLELRRLLEKRYGTGNFVMGIPDVGWLQGIQDFALILKKTDTVESVAQILSAIYEHDQVEFWVES